MAMLCGTLWSTPRATAQEKVSLNIRQVIEYVSRNNSEVTTARQQVKVAQQGEQVAQTAKLPDFSLDAGVNYLGDITIMNRDYSHAMRAAVPHLNTTLELSLYQPLYTGGAITACIEMAEASTRLSKNTLEQTRQATSMRAIACFLELFKATNLRQVYDENIAMTSHLLEEMRARYEQGVVLKNDITRYELRLSTLNYDRLTINNRIGVLNRDLCLLLGLDTQSEVTAVLDDDLQQLPAVLDKASWVQTSLDNALSLKALDVQRDLNSLQRRQLIADRRPKIGFIAVDNLTGPITFEIPAINSNYNVWFFGLNLKYNLSSLFKTGKSLTKNRYERDAIDAGRRATEERLTQTVDDNYTQYAQAYKMLSTETKNVELATENYRLVENRYNHQLALLTDMLDASTAKLDAEVRLVNARVNIIYYYYQLKYNSGTL
jgi:outer membrane protein TolC